MSDKKFDLNQAASRELLYVPVIFALVGSLVFFGIRTKSPASLEQQKDSLANTFIQIDDELDNLASTSSDSVTMEKIVHLKKQIDDVKDKMSEPGVSLDEKNILKKKLNSLKTEYQNYQNTIMENMLTLIDQKDFEIDELHAQVNELTKQLEATKGQKTPVGSKSKVSSIVLSVMALNKKNTETFKSRYVNGLKISLQTNGTADELGFSTLKLEIIDPAGKVISSEGDKILLAEMPATFVFKPTFKYAFKSGRYTIKAFDKGTKFEVAQSITLNNKI